MGASPKSSLLRSSKKPIRAKGLPFHVSVFFVCTYRIIDIELSREQSNSRIFSQSLGSSNLKSLIPVNDFWDICKQGNVGRLVVNTYIHTHIYIYCGGIETRLVWRH